jgi:DNA-3-methyladenine glycosylase
MAQARSILQEGLRVGFSLSPEAMRNVPPTAADRSYATCDAEPATLPTARPPLRRLRRAELPVATVALARYLIGKVLVREHADGRTSGRIVETEAYPPGDAAGHAFGGSTRRNRALYLERGHAYVYFVYGSSYMCNVTSEAARIGAGVLLRALEPLDGIDVMVRRRGSSRLRDLARGPGRLAAALAIDRQCDGVDLCAAGDLWLAAAPWAAGPIARSVRIGITREVARPWRFYERGSVAVSGPRRLRA